MNKLAAWAPLVALVLLALAFGVMLTRGGGERGFSERGLVGSAQPDFALARLDGGEKLTPQSFRGRAHVVNFFASWCVPCRQEHPLLQDLARQGVIVVGVDYKDKPDAAQALLAELGNPFTAVGLDPTGRTGLDFGVTGVPETYVVNADGKIVALQRGPLDKTIIETKIMPALNGK
jgi:cytochrome c biogenesis protein CcmG/thiol:disulfide interchange protein DsbE